MLYAILLTFVRLFHEHGIKSRPCLRLGYVRSKTRSPGQILEKLCMHSRWLAGCFGLNGPLRRYFSLYRAVSQREGERKEK